MAQAAQAKAEADHQEALTAIVELGDALGRRGLTTAQDFGKKVEIVKRANP